ncbi:MAG: hypothetical protein KJ927_12300, partial [Candidatus Eisenbacteria bacterium]|nr:hypothetical protein [Candidatus Eisenbacteria bacterium]
LLGWPPYATIRVIAYICGAIAVSDLMISMILRRNIWNKQITRKFAGWSFLLFLSDIAIKIVIAPQWQKLMSTIISR